MLWNIFHTSHMFEVSGLLSISGCQSWWLITKKGTWYPKDVIFRGAFSQIPTNDVLPHSTDLISPLQCNVIGIGYSSMHQSNKALIGWGFFQIEPKLSLLQQYFFIGRVFASSTLGTEPMEFTVHSGSSPLHNANCVVTIIQGSKGAKRGCESKGGLLWYQLKKLQLSQSKLTTQSFLLIFLTFSTLVFNFRHTGMGLKLPPRPICIFIWRYFQFFAALYFPGCWVLTAGGPSSLSKAAFNLARCCLVMGSGYLTILLSLAAETRTCSVSSVLGASANLTESKLNSIKLLATSVLFVHLLFHTFTTTIKPHRTTIGFRRSPTNYTP